MADENSTAERTEAPTPRRREQARSEGRIARSPEVQQRIGELVKPIEAIRRIIERGQQSGEFRDDLDPRLAAVVFYGGIDEVLTAWVLAQMPDGDEAIAAAERTFLDLIRGGFLAPTAV